VKRVEVITYSLQGNQRSSDRYYEAIATFTDEVLAKVEELQPLIEGFQAFIKRTHCEEVRSQEEYLFEFLTLGTLWRLYCGAAKGLSVVPRRLLTSIVNVRKQGGSIKRLADVSRGVLATLFLSPLGRHSYPQPTFGHLNKLLNWMAATGEFQQEVMRLRAWRDLWSCCAPETTCDDITQAIAFAEWFEQASLTALGEYTPNVDKFLKESQPSRRWKEDVIFTSRRRVEYHVNMVGAELMNRAFKDAFHATKRKAVILPTCMRYHAKPKCQARSNALWCECTGCTPQCRVNQLTVMGEKFGFEVFLVPHESSVFSDGSGKQLLGEDVGIVGIACVLSLVSGGWKARSMGMSPQCVLLDHCGCKKHWHEKGIPTDINVTKLRQILGAGIEREARASAMSRFERSPVRAVRGERARL